MGSVTSKPQIGDRVRVLRTPGYDDASGRRWTYLDNREAVVVKVGGLFAPNYGEAGPAVMVRYRIGSEPNERWVPAVCVEITERLP